jgi:hypothetical protein
VFDQRVQVGGEGVVVVPHGGLAGPAEPAAVVGDHTISGGQQNPVLPLPGVAVERVPVDKHDRLALAVVLVVDVDVGAVFGTDLDVGHDFLQPTFGLGELRYLVMADEPSVAGPAHDHAEVHGSNRPVGESEINAEVAQD